MSQVLEWRHGWEHHQVRLMDMTWGAPRLSVVSRLARAQGGQSLAALL